MAEVLEYDGNPAQVVVQFMGEVIAFEVCPIRGVKGSVDQYSAAFTKMVLSQVLQALEVMDADEEVAH